MRDNHLFRWFYILFIISFLFSSCTDGKGFGGGRGGGGRGGGSRGGGSWGGSKGSGTYGGSSGYSNVNKGRSGSRFKSNAMSFGAGALGGIAAYSLMRSMSHSYHGGPGYYEPGYGTGETCVNNEDMNGTRFGQFRCPLNGFPREAKYCCGEYGKQYCCIREDNSGPFRGASNFGWILLLIIIVVIVIVLFTRRNRQRRKDDVMVPTEPPIEEQQGPPFYHPPPPPMGYPPPPTGNPYAVPPQNYDGNYPSYPQQYQTPYPPQQQMQYPPQQQMQYPPQHQMQYSPQQQIQYPPQQQSHNPYFAKEGGPPAYDDALRNNQGASSTKPS